MNHAAFASREAAGRQLAERLRGLHLVRPLVLAIPRGGIEVGAPLARALGAELDIVLSRKLRSPDQPELALGAISESGDVYLNTQADALSEAGREYLEQEREHQLAEIARRRHLFRAVRPRAPLADRSVILTDDGMATGATLIAAVHTVLAARPRELIIALPVMPSDREQDIRNLCESDAQTPGRLICLISADDFWAVGQFYRDFTPVQDERVVELLEEFANPRGPSAPHRP